MSNFLTTIFDTAELVLTDIQTGAKAIEPVAAAIPGGMAVDAAVEAATAATLAAVTASRAIVAAASPEVAQVEAYLDKLFHITQTPQAIVLTPKTTSATVGKK